jgi:putative DNA primase/helicase
MSLAPREAAVNYHRAGWAPIPIKHRSKEPALEKLAPYLERRATQDELNSWRWPGVGIVTGVPSGVLVLDADGPEGEAELRKRGGHPPTPTVRTGGDGGLQIYFRHPETPVRTGIRVAPGLDVKATGGYVVAPPSIGPTGKRYEWIISPEELELADPPEWLLRLLDRAPRRNGSAPPVGERIPVGRRNQELTSLAGTMRRRGMDEAEILAAISVSNSRRCDLPLPEDEIAKIAHSVARYEPANGQNGQTPPSANGLAERAPGSRFNLTDLGNAERFVRDHGANVRYCHHWRRWLVWDGRRWAPDETGEVVRLMKSTVRGIYAEAASGADKAERKAIADHAKRSESRERIVAALALAQSEPGIPVLPAELDSDPWAFNVANGTLDLRTGKLQDHRREDLLTKIAPVEYDPVAKAPLFEAFLREILPSEAVRSFVQRAAGYALNGTTREHVLPVFYGTGMNGKTTLLLALREMFGDYGLQAADDLLMAKRDAHPTERADLFGKRFVANVETEQDRRLSEAMVKHLTGGDPIRARRMREDLWEFKPTHMLVLATNHKPVIRGTDDAIWRRVKLVPFEVTIPEERQDKALPEKLLSELPGVLTWAVQGHAAWVHDGLGEPVEVRSATAGYRAEMDVLAAFFEDRCVIHKDAEAPASLLYQTYRAWCEEAGEKPETQRSFGTRLRERDLGDFRYTGGPYKDRKGWRGIGLVTTEGLER